MEQIYTVFCSFTLFIINSWMFSVINCWKMNNLKTKNFQERRKILKDNKMFLKNQGHNAFW